MMLRILKIVGDSLYPQYRHNDFVVLLRFPLLARIRPGDTVVVQNIRHFWMIKKVDSFLPESDRIFVVGNSPHSIDSRSFGAIRRQDIVGKVVFHIQSSVKKAPL